MREFKWHQGPVNEEAEQHPDPTTYYCPFCGEPAGPDSWWTQEQLAYIEAMQMAAALRTMDAGLDDVFRGVSSKHIKLKRTGHLDIPDEPTPPIEPDDMTAVISPCHPYEPVKVPAEIPGPFRCLLCGSAFSV